MREQSVSIDGPDRAEMDKKKKKNHSSPPVAEAGRTQRTVIPQVKYHPSIQTQTPRGELAQAKSTSRPDAGLPTQTGTTSKMVQQTQDAGKVNPRPTARPGPDSRTNQNHKSPKRVQRRSAYPDQLQTDEVSEKEPSCMMLDPVDPERQLDKNTLKEVERLTCGQRKNKKWFAWRKNRITASVAPAIAGCRFVNGKSRTPPTSYLATITGEARGFQTRAMKWGIENEEKAICHYQKMKSSILGRSVKVLGCGLFIDKCRPWLAASPDGIVTDDQGAKWLLEVKCPYKHRDTRVEDACRDPTFCLEIKKEEGQQPDRPPSYHLKKSHNYFTQIQCQLAVTGLQHADLVVFTSEETAIVRVSFDPQLWEDTLSKLEKFYREVVLPHLKKKRLDEAAVMTPEL